MAIPDTESKWLYSPPVRLELRAVVANLEFAIHLDMANIFGDVHKTINIEICSVFCTRKFFIVRVRSLTMFTIDAVPRTVGLETFWFRHDEGFQTCNSVSRFVCA